MLLPCFQGRPQALAVPGTFGKVPGTRQHIAVYEVCEERAMLERTDAYRRAVMRRSVLLCLVVAVLWAPGVAAAKMPFYSIEFESDVSVDEPVTVTVRLWSNKQHTVRAEFHGPGVLEDFVRAFPLDAEGARIKDDQVRATVRRIAPAVYRGSMTFPDARTWVVCPLRCEGSVPAGYPAPFKIHPTTPVDPMGIASEARPGWIVWPTVAAAVLLAGLLAFRRKARPA
jgi:hypothetical protein